jgi:hypothetical protein
MFITYTSNRMKRQLRRNQLEQDSYELERNISMEPSISMRSPRTRTGLQ